MEQTDTAYVYQVYLRSPDILQGEVLVYILSLAGRHLQFYLISPLPHSSKSSIPPSQAPPTTPPPAWHHQQHPHRAVGHTGNLHLTDGVIGFFQKKITSATYVEADLPLSISTSWKKEDETAFTASPPLPCKLTLTDENRVYQIKSNAINQLSVDSPNATFDSKANIQDITDPLNPISIDGNAALQMTLTDNGEPGSSDSIAITLWNKNGGLWYSSNWDGIKTIEQNLDGGNLVVK